MTCRRRPGKWIGGRAGLVLLACWPLFLPLGASASEPRLADVTVVVFNETVPESKTLAQYYAQQRGIEASHLVGLHCPPEEEIDRQVYDQQIAEPLRAQFITHGWWQESEPTEGTAAVVGSQIRFVTLIRGIPLKIRACNGYPGDHPDPTTPFGQSNQAAVDSELAALGFRSRQISGPLKNLYYRSFLPITDPEIDPRLLLVGRIDGPTVGEARRMVDDAIGAERTGLSGWTVIDERGTNDPAYKIGDDWLEHIVAAAFPLGFPTLVDRQPDLFPAGFPLNDVMLYFGWYAEHLAGALADPGFRFRPGAIAVHIHSTSGSTVRSPDRFWVGPLIRHGAAATLGNVYEPYLGLTPELDVFFDRLTHGMTFAESAYASLVGLSWMTTIVGDPLYRPFPVNLDGPRGPLGWRDYQALAERYHNEPEQLASHLLHDEKEPLAAEFAGLVLAAANRPDEAIPALLRARRTAKARPDRLRALLEAVAVLRTRQKRNEADELVRREGGEFRDDTSRHLLESYGAR
ncbi:MAG TPA: TIGR03790 family protein [Chthoniobacterales bacterium]